MMIDRFAMERIAEERQAEWLREADESRQATQAQVVRRAVGAVKPRTRWVSETTSFRRWITRLASVATLALLAGGHDDSGHHLPLGRHHPAVGVQPEHEGAAGEGNLHRPPHTY